MLRLGRLALRLLEELAHKTHTGQLLCTTCREQVILEGNGMIHHKPSVKGAKHKTFKAERGRTDRAGKQITTAMVTTPKTQVCRAGRTHWIEEFHTSAKQTALPHANGSRRMHATKKTNNYNWRYWTGNQSSVCIVSPTDGSGSVVER